MALSKGGGEKCLGDFRVPLFAGFSTVAASHYLGGRRLRLPG